MPQKSPRPTQRTIAEKAGVSVAAVSRALANDPMMAKSTRKKIRQIADELGYSPDRAAQRLRTGKTNVISLVLPPHEEILGFGTSMIRGISAALKDTPYHLVVLPNFDPDGEDDEVRRIVRNDLADGILMSRAEPNDPRVRFLLEADFPFVIHGRTELATPHPYVDFDNCEFARMSAQNLIDAGAQKLGILLPPRQFTFGQHLLHGFMQTVRATGIPYEILTGATLDSDPSDISAALTRRFEQPDCPDGLILPGETSGLAALAALHDLGRVPGRDVFLAVKQTSGLFDLVRPKVPSLFEDIAAAGEIMAQFLIRRINGAPAETLQFIQPSVFAHDGGLNGGLELP